MKEKVVAMLILLGASFVTGCAHRIAVTYRSEPPLAMLYQGSKQMGVAPIILTYELTKDMRDSGNARLQGLTARWISGATSEISSLNVDLSTGLNQEYTFFRPQSFPGLALDIQHVSDYQRNMVPLMLLQQQQQQQERQLNMPSCASLPPGMAGWEKAAGRCSGDLHRPSTTMPRTYNTNCTTDYLGNVHCTTN